jgi:hypothetical protein
MALSSGVQIILELNRLPLLPGAIDLARKGNKTRASASNRSFSQSTVSVDADADPILTEFVLMRRLLEDCSSVSIRINGPTSWSNDRSPVVRQQPASLDMSNPATIRGLLFAISRTTTTHVGFLLPAPPSI